MKFPYCLYAVMACGRGQTSLENAQCVEFALVS